MKKALSILALLISTNIYANDISVCDGRFESGQSVHVKIDWDSKTVSVNKFQTFIEGIVWYGIVTGTYTNKLNQRIFSIIGHFRNAGTFIAQNQDYYGQFSPTNFARLTCSQSFYTPFTDRTLEN